MEKRTFREHLQYVLLWLLFIWISCLCAVVIDLLLMKIISSIVVLSFRVEAVLHVICMLIGTSIPLGAISYMISYHLGAFSFAYSTVEGGLALILQGLVGFLLAFPVWITGGVKWLAGLLEYGKRLYLIEDLDDIALRYYLLAFFAFGLFYMAVKTILGLVGKRNRIKFRTELTGSPIKPTERG